MRPSEGWGHDAAADAEADFRFFHGVLNRDVLATDVAHVRTLLLTPCLSGGRGCPPAREWTLYVGQRRLADGRAIAALGARLREAGVRISAKDAPRWHDEEVADAQECSVGAYAGAVVLEADGDLVFEDADGACCAVIPRYEIAAALDKWTPLWRLPQTPAIDAAEAPVNEEG